jgi:hypothetical protein
MKYYVKLLVFISMISITCYSQNEVKKDKKWPILKGPYLGQKPPGMIPEIFAPGIISRPGISPGISQYFSTFSPDQKELYFTRVSKDASIMVCQLENGIWTKPDPVSFARNHIDFQCSFSPDGNKMFFNRWDSKDSSIPNGIWVVERKNKNWGIPKFLFDGNCASITDDGGMYFAKWIDRSNNVKKIFKSNLENGKYTEPQLIDSDFNKSFYKVNHPFIHPEENYIIFDACIPKEEKYLGLFVSFKKKNNKWSKAYNLNLGENTHLAKVTPDMKYLFFSRFERDKKTNESLGFIYWVSAKKIDECRPKELK